MEGIPIKLVFTILFLLLGELCHSQGLNQLLSQINREEENPLPDDDILSLEYIEYSYSGLNSTIIYHIEGLSFLDEGDIALIKSSNESQSIPLNKLSENGELFVEFLNTLNQIKLPTDIYFKQYFTAKNDLQVRLTGRINRRDNEFGFLVERDPFEVKALDQTSMYLNIKTRFGNIIFGDFQINNGFGLLLWRSVPVKKGIGSFSQLSRIGKGLKVYKSSHENWNFRGVGSKIYTRFGRITISIGETKRDGVIDSTGQLKIFNTGIHVSESEISRKESLNEKSSILNWEKEVQKTIFGSTVLSAQWVENKRQLNTIGQSLYFKTTIDVIELFGEMAIGNNRTHASVLGIKSGFKLFKYIGIIRSIDPKYSSLRSNPSTEWSSTLDGENGIYQSILFKINNHRFSLFNDIFKKRVNSDPGLYPESGFESGAQYEKRGKKFTLRLRVKNENKTPTNTGFIADELIKKIITTRYQATGYYTHSNQLKSKLQLNVTAANESMGYGINYRMDKQISHVNYIFDWTSSDVKSFDARIYFWDINLPGEMRSKMVSYIGHNLGIRVVFKSEQYRLSFRLSSTWKNSYLNIHPEVNSGLLLESYF